MLQRTRSAFLAFGRAVLFDYGAQILALCANI
jgi:hypothetical protein